ncbi:MAG: DUF1574 domain-containing protein, partial [Spirochaetia bacterium]|nr:DUF1574 domain-containing protein [Spirochaetia bacterium]
MKKYNLQFYFILFFLLDKLILLPIFKFNITETLPGTPYLETLENKEPERFHTDDYKNHKKVWLFGSSRSLWYYVLPVPKNTLADPFLDRHAKEKLNQYHFVPFASPGSNTSIYYVRLNQLLERGYKPDLIALELSIYAFNHNNRFVHSSKIEGFPLMFTLKHSNEMPFEFSRDIITSRIFATTRYKITVTGIKHNLFGIRPPGQNAMLEQLFSGSADPFQAFF